MKATSTASVHAMASSTPTAEAAAVSLTALLPTALDEEDPGPWLGEVIDDAHPLLRGRVLVRLPRGAERWMPTLRGTVPRRGDRVAVMALAGAGEQVVTGVLDGLSSPRPAPIPRGDIRLARGQCVRIDDSGGQPLLDIFDDAEGRVVVALRRDAQTLDVDGDLTIAARRIELVAREGGVRVHTEADVTIEGEIIELNP